MIHTDEINLNENIIPHEMMDAYVKSCGMLNINESYSRIRIGDEYVYKSDHNSLYVAKDGHFSLAYLCIVMEPGFRSKGSLATLVAPPLPVYPCHQNRRVYRDSPAD